MSSSMKEQILALKAGGGDYYEVAIDRSGQLLKKEEWGRDCGEEVHDFIFRMPNALEFCRVQPLFSIVLRVKPASEEEIDAANLLILSSFFFYCNKKEGKLEKLGGINSINKLPLKVPSSLIQFAVFTIYDECPPYPEN